MPRKSSWAENPMPIVTSKVKKRVIQVTIQVEPVSDSSKEEVSTLIRSLLGESCCGDDSDSFREVQVVSKSEVYV